MFRDIILVSATDAGKSRRTNGRPSDASAVTLLGQVRVWAAEIRERRARKVETIVRRLARLTFHRLARGTLRLTEARILKEWEVDCASLIGGMGNAPGDLANVTRDLLRRFAQAMEMVRPGQHRAPDPLARRGRWRRGWYAAAGVTGAALRQAHRCRPHHAVAHRAGARRLARSQPLCRLRRRAAHFAAARPARHRVRCGGEPAGVRSPARGRGSRSVRRAGAAGPLARPLTPKKIPTAHGARPGLKCSACVGRRVCRLPSST